MTDTDQDGSPPARAGFVAHERPQDAASAMAICLLSATEVEAALPELVAVLHDAVERGASVGFLPPLSAEEGQAYWRDVVTAVAAGSRLVLVSRQARRQGLGRALMLALEAEAARRGRTTIVLDTRQGDPSERLYAGLGYSLVGVVPQYARSADGALHPTAFYYKLLTRAG